MLCVPFCFFALNVHFHMNYINMLRNYLSSQGHTVRQFLPVDKVKALVRCVSSLVLCLNKGLSQNITCGGNKCSVHYLVCRLPFFPIVQH